MATGEQGFNAAIQNHMDGNIGEAERLYKSFLADHPDRDDAHFGDGLLCLNAERKEDAVRNFERALFLAPGSISPTWSRPEPASPKANPSAR